MGPPVPPAPLRWEELPRVPFDPAEHRIALADGTVFADLAGFLAHCEALGRSPASLEPRLLVAAPVAMDDGWVYGHFEAMVLGQLPPGAQFDARRRGPFPCEAPGAPPVDEDPRVRLLVEAVQPLIRSADLVQWRRADLAPRWTDDEA
jgi:hypothetical protein